MDRDTKLDTLCDQLNGIAHMLGKVLEMYMANLNANDDYLEKPMHFPDQEQTPDPDNEQDMYDAQESVEDEEEGNREVPDGSPLSCTMLTKKYHNLIVKDNGECCIEGTSDHI